MGRGGRTKGPWGETQACSFLQRQGFTIIERNYHATVGEIDIVAKKNGDFYFIEVKTRQIGPFAYDVALTSEKQRRLRKTVLTYCYRRSITASRILACLMVIVDKSASRVTFRLAVLL